MYNQYQPHSHLYHLSPIQNAMLSMHFNSFVIIDMVNGPVSATPGGVLQILLRMPTSARLLIRLWSYRLGSIGSFF